VVKPLRPSASNTAEAGEREENDSGETSAEGSGRYWQKREETGGGSLPIGDSRATTDMTSATIGDGEDGAGGRAGGRRAGKVVSYREPKLNTKMRRE